MEEPVRTCAKCFDEKPLSEFPKCNYMQSGYDVRCSECVKDSAKRFAERTKPMDEDRRRLVI